MPKKRFRNGRGRKRRYKLRKSDKINEELDIARLSPEVSSIGSLSNLVEIQTAGTQTKTPSPRVDLNKTPLNNELQAVASSITDTPINKRRSWNRERKSHYGSMNITNLNFIFDSSFTNSPKSECSLLDNRKSPALQRSKSSTPNLSSGKEKTKSLDQSSQIDTYSCQINSITETPKYNTLLLQENTIFKSFSFSKNEINSEKINKCYEKEVNINPYLKCYDIDRHRNSTFDELSFFSPNLFEHKSSTPVDKILNKAINIDEQVAICDLNISKLELKNNFIDNSFGTPRLNTNLNVNDGVSPDKLMNKADSMRNLMHNTSLCKKTPNLKTSPKKKNIVYSRVYSRTRHFSCSHMNVSRRSSHDGNRTPNMSTFQRILMKFRKYCTASQVWSSKVVEICTQLGMQLKNSISSLCKNNDTSLETTKQSVTCNCEEYKKEVEKLRGEVEAQKKKSEDTEHELQKVREEIAHLSALGKELKMLKDQCKCFQRSSTQPPTPCLPPAPCLPPPPPPPPPPPSFLTITNPLVITKKSKSAVDEKENSRPKICVEDILKVKLKKTSERHQTPVNRHSSQPLISMDMLRQVKLRPASRNSFRAETPDNISELTTSPHSSLCRLLKNESSAVTRLKRLRRVGAYSSDSIYRRKELSRRDRDREDS